MNYIHGPLLSSSDLDYHVRLFEAVFDLKVTSISSLSKEQVLATWGCSGYSARTATLETPGSLYGVRIIEFSPLPDSTIRHRSRGMRPGAPKVIDFFVSDLDKSLQNAREFGMAVVDDIAAYDSPEGRVREAHAWILDEVVCALIEAPREMHEKFSADMKRPVSEPQSISGPTTNAGVAVEFFETVLGFPVLYEYEVNDSNFGDMIGSSASINIKAKNIGSDLQKPYIGLINYGEGSDGDDINGVSLPVRGLLGITVVTQEIAAIAARATLWSGDEHAVAENVPIEPWGLCSSLVLKAPNGSLLHIIEPEQ